MYNGGYMVLRRRREVMMENEIKLKPCPFCGGKAELHSQDTPIGMSYIECRECGVQMGGGNDAEALKQWNNRHEDRCDEANKPHCVGIASIDDMSRKQLTTIVESSPMRFYNGCAVYSELLAISIALHDIHRVQHETARVIAIAVEQRVSGIVASLLGIDDKGGAK